MLTNGHKKDCGFGDEIVSYIYGEIGVTERSVFETHLADCPLCTDEFAAISNARFSVFEWQREEFAHLLTPEIIIPYAAKKRTIEENAKVGYLPGLRAIFGLPIAVAASLLLCLGLGFVAITYLGGDQHIASNVNVPQITVHEKNTNILDPLSDIQVPPTHVAIVKPASEKEINSSEIRTGKTIGNPRSNRQTTDFPQRSADNIPQRNLQNRKAPVLSNYEENDDKSLRLSDLFEDEVGAKR